jgi:transcription termination factor Rho
MAVLERSELEASPLSDLHAIADQIGLEGYRRLRKAELIDAILGSPGRDGTAAAEEQEAADGEEARGDGGALRGRLRRRRGRRAEAVVDGEPAAEEPVAARGDAAEREPAPPPRGAGRVVSGVVEVLGNGSAFLRVHPPEPSDEDVYISAAQVRRCELVSGDSVSGPVRTPRRSERYPSLVRVDTINDAPADSVADGSRFEDLPVTWPSERLALGSGERTLEAIEWLTPFGLGSRVVIVGGRMAGKTRTLRRLSEALAGREGLEVTLVLAGARPEELSEWAEGPVAPVAALGPGASGDAQAQAVERAVDAARRTAARGGNALVMIDTLDGLSAGAARRALAAARNLRDGGSLTIIATASEPLGGETTVIALDPNLTTTGREPILDLLASGTVRAEALVGEDGARAIERARVQVLEG